jgi:hypothetical protein
MLGRVISGIWNVRSEIYNIHPEIKPDFVKEYENDEKRYQYLNGIAKKAFEMESCGNINGAMDAYEELYSNSSFGHFRFVAEAGLYRTKNNRAE